MDALFEFTITSAASQFSYEPRFGRLGVFVNSTVTFRFRPDGHLRTFQFKRSPLTFNLNRSRATRSENRMQTGVAHSVQDDGYLLAALCVG